MKALEILKKCQHGEIYQGLNKYVNPKKDSRFSPNLYQFLTYSKSKYFANIFQDKKTNRYYLGHMQDGWFCGAMLMGIFCYGSRVETFAYAPKDCSEFTDITDWFWQKYFEVGKAIYDLPEWHTPNYKTTA